MNPLKVLSNKKVNLEQIETQKSIKKTQL